MSSEELITYLSAEFHSINDFTEEWVTSIIDGNFTEYDGISAVVKPSFLENSPQAISEYYRKLSNLLIKYQSRSEDSKIWLKLREKSVCGNKLSLLLWYSIETALNKDSSGQDIKIGVSAACCYMYLCSIKGSTAYNIFNTYLYLKCLELFRQLYRCMTYDSRGADTKKKAKGKGKGKKNAIPEHSELGDTIVPVMDGNEARDLLETCTKGLYVMVTKVALSASPDAALATAELVRDICRIDASKDSSVEAVETLSDFTTLEDLSDRCFALLHILCEQKHSMGAVLVYSRVLFPRLSYWGFDLSTVSSSATIPASFTMWKDLAVKFIGKRISVCPPEEMQTIFKVLENLFCRCIDRQDYRSRVSTTVVDILSLLPKAQQWDFVQRINVFSKNAKNSLRNFSIEAVPLILKTLDFSGPDPFVEVKEEVNETMEQTRGGRNRTQRNKTVVESDTEQEEQEERENNEDNSDDEQEKRKKAKKAKKPTKVLLPPRVNPLTILYRCVICYCVDKGSSVRGRALLQLASLLADDNHHQRLVEHAQTLLAENPNLFSGKPDVPKRAEEHVEELDDVEEDEETLINIDSVILHIICTALADEKANVRKAALIASEAYFKSIENTEQFETLETLLKKRCVDASVMVRKQGAETVSNIMASSDSFIDELHELWLTSVLPMISDREQNVAQMSAKIITDTLITPLKGNTSEHVWMLLRKIEQKDCHMRLLIRALFHQSREGNLDQSIVAILQKKLDKNNENEAVIWMLLSQLSVVFKVDPASALRSWNSLDDMGSNIVRYICRILTSSDKMIDDDDKKALIEDLKIKIYEFSIPAQNISSVYLCLSKMMDAVGEAATGWAILKEYGTKVLSICRKQLRKHLEDFAAEFPLEEGRKLLREEDLLIRVITTVGEVIQFSPQLLPTCTELIKALKTIMAADTIVNEEFGGHMNSAVPSINPTPHPSRPATAAADDPGSHAPYSQPQGSSQGSQPLSSQGAIIPSHMINPGHILGGKLFTPVVRACCVLAIGKFCLMDERLAKECVPVLVRQLKVNQDHVIRNNVMFVICDLCIRYTLLVDRYSPIIAGCLKDKSTLVRHHTLESLTNLIKEQFIRWEGQIMYRFVSTILDENKAIREYAEFCLKDVLLLQFPGMFYNHFIECLLYFNGVNRKFMPGGGDLECDASLKFTLSGRSNYGARMSLYKFMLETFDDKQKFLTMSHVCEQILLPVYAGEMSFNDPNVKSLLADAFDVMSSKEIKLNMDVGKGDDEDDEPSPAIVAMAKKMVTETFRKGIILSIMPPLLEMRSFLIEQKSSLIRGCFAVLKAICKEHQEQIDEFLAGDRQLKSEIEYDIKLYEQRELARKLAAKRAAEEARLKRRKSRRSMLPQVNVEETLVEQNAQEATVVPEQNAQPVDVKEENQTVVEEQTAMETEEPEVNKAPVEPNEEPVEMEQDPVGEPEENVEMTAILTKEEPEQQEVVEKSPTKQLEELTVADHTPTKRTTRRSSETSEKSSETEETTNVSRRTRSCKKTQENDPPEEGFTVPVTTRKRSHKVSSDESILNPRAFSTPNKTLDVNLTFPDLNLSAIRKDDDTPLRTRQPRRRSQRSTLQKIAEDE